MRIPCLDPSTALVMPRTSPEAKACAVSAFLMDSDRGTTVAASARRHGDGAPHGVIVQVAHENGGASAQLITVVLVHAPMSDPVEKA